MIEGDAKLFQRVRVGNLELAHRVVHAPLTRFRATDAHVPTDLMVDYYSQRASTPGSLLVAEATFISPQAGGYDNVPGIWSDDQVAGWKKVTDAVHAQGSFIFLQLWHLGRASTASVLAKEDSPANPGGPYSPVGPSTIPLPDRPDGPLRALTHEEILETIEDYKNAAHNAVHRAGFDGVEVHGAHGYLVDQFLQDTANQRTDQWGGNIANRSRFALEVVKKVVEAVGEERAALRLSPFNDYQGMHMKHPQPQFAHLVSCLREAHPRLAYLHVVEPRISAHVERAVSESESNDFLRAIWKGPNSEANGSVYISAGGYKLDNAMDDADKKGDLIAFGRSFIPNPDLPARLMMELPLMRYERKAFYGVGDPKGYVDYAFADPQSEARYLAQRQPRLQVVQ